MVEVTEVTRIGWENDIANRFCICFYPTDVNSSNILNRIIIEMRNMITIRNPGEFKSIRHTNFDDGRVIWSLKEKNLYENVIQKLDIAGISIKLYVEI